MEALKGIFGDGALSYDQFMEKVSEKKMKLADLSEGAYVGKEKFDTLLAEKDGLKAMLDEANGKLEGYDPQWKKKAEEAQNEAAQKLERMEKSYLLKEQTASIPFSSQSAKKAFLAELESRNLPVSDGKVMGLEDFVKAYKETDPDAFLPDQPAPKFSAPGAGKAPVSSEKSMLDSKYKNNPFYRRKGEE